MALPVGATAPLFTLRRKTADGLSDVALADSIGKRQVVLLFFPLAFTSVCTDEMCSVTQDLDTYATLGADVFAISVDSPFAQEAWAKQNYIRTPILSDFGRTAATAYDVIYPELVGLPGVAKRSAFVIGLDGKIKFAWSSDNPRDLPSFDAIKAALQA